MSGAEPFEPNNKLTIMDFSFATLDCNSRVDASKSTSSYVIEESQLQFDVKDKVGEGGNATVYVGVYGGNQVAIKQVKMDNPGLPRNARLIINEAKELLNLDHPNVVKCYGVCTSKGILVLEFAKKMVTVDGTQYAVHSLRQLLDTLEDSFPLKLKHHALLQIASGLEYLKSKRVNHTFTVFCVSVLLK